MEKIHGNFGFGCMRLPMKDGKADRAEFCEMVDAFLGAGFNYFDTAQVYLGGDSEVALHDCLVARYPREAYILTDKLSSPRFKTAEDIRPFFENQVKTTGAGYFDFYLIHAMGRTNYPHYEECRAFEQALEFKAEGKIRHLGISFHDSADFLEKILTDHPEIEVVQLQINYLDYDSPSVQSRKCLEVANKFGKPVIVMEPVKGGSLVRLPEKALAHLDALHGGSPASYALRFAAGCPGVFMVLSGMSNSEQMRDNLSAMKDFKPLDGTERAALDKVLKVFSEMDLIPCTSCRYCVEGCPMKIRIPGIFSVMNDKTAFDSPDAAEDYQWYAEQGAPASSCIKCGKCEASCPQKLPIRELLQKAAAIFEK